MLNGNSAHGDSTANAVPGADGARTGRLLWWIFPVTVWRP
jgi:hypothetical protein